MPELSMLFDAVIATLLVATIGYAIVLNRKLRSLRDAKAELESLVGRLTDSTNKAERGLQALREHARETADALQQQLGKGDRLADDLAFLLERGGSLAERLEADLAKGRAVQPGPTPRAISENAAPAARPAANERKRTETLRPAPKDSALFKALQGVR